MQKGYRPASFFPPNLLCFSKPNLSSILTFGHLPFVAPTPNPSSFCPPLLCVNLPPPPSLCSSFSSIFFHLWTTIHCHLPPHPLPLDETHHPSSYLCEHAASPSPPPPPSSSLLLHLTLIHLDLFDHFHSPLLFLLIDPSSSPLFEAPIEWKNVTKNLARKSFHEEHK